MGDGYVTLSCLIGDRGRGNEKGPLPLLVSAIFQLVFGADQTPRDGRVVVAGYLLRERDGRAGERREDEVARSLTTAARRFTHPAAPRLVRVPTSASGHGR
jgi:hypothetical protein